MPEPVVAVRPVDGDQLYVVPPLAVSVVEVPVHIATDAPPLMVGKALTVTVFVPVLIHPLASVPVTVYIVVVVGLAVMPEPVVAVRPVDGDQLYVVPPPAVSVVEVPVHIATDEPPLMVGSAFTVTVLVPVLIHPFASVPVTVYAVVADGLAVMPEPVVAVRPVDGDQL